MAVMVNGGGAGGGGGWIDITDSVTLGSGKSVEIYSDGFKFEDNENYGYVIIEGVQPGERYRITGWMGYSSPLTAACFGEDGVGKCGNRRSNGTEERYDNYGRSPVSELYATLETAIPKLSGITKLIISHYAIGAGSTYDDVIVEKYIG